MSDSDYLNLFRGEVQIVAFHLSGLYNAIWVVRATVRRGEGLPDVVYVLPQ